MNTHPTRFPVIIFALAALAASVGSTGAFAEPMTAFPGSVLRVDLTTGRFMGRSGRITELAGQVIGPAADQTAEVKFHVALKMRNLPELRERLANGEIISQAEMADRYYPLAEDWQSVADWLTSQGLQVVPENPGAPLHLGVITHGPLATVSQALGCEFAAVQGADGKTYNSAVSEPYIPSRFADKILGVTGLQPHIRPQVQQVHIPVTPDDFVPNQATGKNVYVQTFGPIALLNYYHGLPTGYGGTLPFDGTGQTIAIMMTQDQVPLMESDLVQFWAGAHSTHTLADLTVVNPGWFSPVPTQYNEYDGECEIDLEWSSGMAQRAKIRLYDTYAPSEYVPQIIADKATIPGLNQASISVTEPEDMDTPDDENSQSQYFAALAAAGVTMFAASGDGGSNPLDTGPNAGSAGYPNSLFSVCYPACDPSVVAVGGTCILCPNTGKDPLITGYPPFDTTTVLGETGWSGSGGGYSVVFDRPSWQVGLGSGVTANSNGNSGAAMRTVPDISAPASGMPHYGVADGSVSGGGGTSYSSPMWAGICALLNQARTKAGEQPVGMLAPKLYAIAATPQGAQALSDITPTTAAQDSYYQSKGWYTPDDNSNGAYSVTAGYDLVTGLGSPNIAGLIAALTGATITANPTGQTINLGSAVTFTAAATATVPATNGTLYYQWQLNGKYLSDGTDANGATMIGTHTAQLLITGTTADDAGNYTCVAIFTPHDGSPVYMKTTAANLIVTGTSTPGHVLAISARAYVGSGDNILIGGFFIAGKTSVTVLIQALGPALAQEGVQDHLKQPVLTLHQTINGKDVILYSNTGWGSKPVLLAAAASVYAQPVLEPGSADSELLVTLPPGSYTAQVAGESGGTGVALCSIYEAQ